MNEYVLQRYSVMCLLEISIVSSKKETPTTLIKVFLNFSDYFT